MTERGQRIVFRILLGIPAVLGLIIGIAAGLLPFGVGGAGAFAEDPVPVQGIIGGYLELAPGEEGMIPASCIPENATNPEIRTVPITDHYAVEADADGHMTAKENGDAQAQVYSAENPGITGTAYILVHEPFVISSDGIIREEDGLFRVTLYGSGSVKDFVNSFTVRFSENVDGTGNFDYRGCEFSCGLPGVSVTSRAYDGNYLVIRSAETFANDLPVNFTLTLVFEAKDRDALPETEPWFSIAEFRPRWWATDGLGEYLPYNKYVSIPGDFCFGLTGGATPLTEADAVLPEDTEIIGEEAFAGIDAERIRLAEGVTEIGKRAFADCWKLKSIYIPEGCGKIAWDAFENDGEITIYGKAGSPAEEFARGRYFFVPVE